LARCRLDISNAKFRLSVGDDPALNKGLEELSTKVAKDHKTSGWVVQPMPGFPQHQNKIWKWDFAPEGAHSSTRKSWRLLAHVPDPQAAEPVEATPFLAYPRSENPSGNPAKYVADALKRFLSKTIIKTEEVKFKRQIDSAGRTISLCMDCWGAVCDPTADITEIEIAEGTHGGICQGTPE
jgi:hypothetical protein